MRVATLPSRIDFAGHRIAGLRLADSRDVDQSNELSARLFGAARMRRLRAGGAFHYTHDHVPFGPVSFDRMSWGAHTALVPRAESLPGYYIVNLPIRGAARVRQDGHVQQLAQGAGGVFSPLRSFEIEAYEDFDHMVVRVDAAFLASAWQGISGQPLTAPLYFEPAIPDTPSLAASWMSIVTLGASVAKLPLGSAAREYAQNALAASVASVLLTQHPHNHRFLLDEQPQGAPAPRVVRLAEEFMLQRLREAVTVEAVSAACGVSRRSLFAAFQAHHGVGPMAWLRQRRLEAARALLEKPSREDLRVADVALELGFSHVGEFAAAYGRAFGESPSVTLRRNRR
ncbi:helix-turn-helix transcriptional regulator [Ramlibacter albus]|uniref:AraC family transcriptional regulator n=1 Tax=Ramlibacter albus TaxID=2079448 RepID=A0A923MF33_9BURK|nr:AraC family transcriptional regulator [Ramlibacter albus]MBC5767837.1 AraC family transcriptional regulator [Ramlibacter albus]